MPLTQKQINFWQENGYLLLANFYSNERIDKFNKYIDILWNKRKKLNDKYVIDIFVETEKEKRVYFCDAPKNARNYPYKLNDLFLSSELVRELTAGNNIAPILSELLDGDLPMICNTLNFEFGSQQDYHFDTFYMPPPTPNKMIASWLALEDATASNGPLSYYPGSHKIPAYNFSSGSTIIVPEEMPDFKKYMEKEINERNLEPKLLLANKGDLLIWHSQLYHGGSKIINKKKTRKSLVTHYFTHEDFQESNAPMINKNSCYMARNAQAVGYQYSQPKNLLQRIFS